MQMQMLKKCPFHNASLARNATQRFGCISLQHFISQQAREKYFAALLFVLNTGKDTAWVIVVNNPSLPG